MAITDKKQTVRASRLAIEAICTDNKLNITDDHCGNVELWCYDDEGEVIAEIMDVYHDR